MFHILWTMWNTLLFSHPLLRLCIAVPHSPSQRSTSQDFQSASRKRIEIRDLFSRCHSFNLKVCNNSTCMAIIPGHCSINLPLLLSLFQSSWTDPLFPSRCIMQAFSPERTVEAPFLQLTPKTTTFLQHNGLFPPLSLSLSLLQDHFLPLYSQFSRPSFCSLFTRPKRDCPMNS